MLISVDFVKLLVDVIVFVVSILGEFVVDNASNSDVVVVAVESTLLMAVDAVFIADVVVDNACDCNVVVVVAESMLSIVLDVVIVADVVGFEVGVKLTPLHIK